MTYAAVSKPARKTGRATPPRHGGRLCQSDGGSQIPAGGAADEGMVRGVGITGRQGGIRRPSGAPVVRLAGGASRSRSCGREPRRRDDAKEDAKKRRV